MSFFLKSQKVLLKNWSILQQFEEMSFLLTYSNIPAYLVPAMDHYNKCFFSFLMGRDFFSKYFRIVSVFHVNFLLTRISNQDSIDDRHYLKKLGPTRLYCGFWVELKVTMALTNCFRKKTFLYFLNFAFICFLFCSPIICCPQIFFQEVELNLDTSFTCYLMSVMTLNKFVLRDID